jgi:hypothetical protein
MHTLLFIIYIFHTLFILYVPNFNQNLLTHYKVVNKTYKLNRVQIDDYK